MEKWKKIGLIAEPRKIKINWWKSFGMDPCTIHLKNSIYRVFFCGRNNKNISLIGSFDVDLKNPKKVFNFSKKPILLPGKLGAFDDNGVTASCVIKEKNKLLLYYIGWKPRSTTRYSLMTGLAISTNKGKSFKRFSKAPILFLTNKEPFSILTAPYVLKLKKNKWIMWYVSCNEWVRADYPKYDIKVAHSKDGYNWMQTGKTCIKLKKDERAIARPSVIYEDKIFKMYYCYEKKIGKYKMGYAISKNGLNWIRKDNLINLTTSKKKDEWDSDMIAYPHVIKFKNKKYMFYNGNGYGKDGIALAIQE